MATMATKTIKVIPGETPPPTEVLAQAIVDISQAMKLLHSSRLNEKTLHLLISHSSGVSQRDVKAVLSAAYYLEATYLKPAVRK